MLTEEKYKQVLLEIIERFLGGKLSVRQFWEEFNSYYADGPDIGRLYDYDESFFDEVSKNLHYMD
jgi:hypothetical protein